MNNRFNMLPERTSFDLKCSKVRWRLGLRPRPRWGSLRRSPRPPNREGPRAFGARQTYSPQYSDPPTFFGTNHTLNIR